MVIVSFVLLCVLLYVEFDDIKMRVTTFNNIGIGICCKDKSCSFYKEYSVEMYLFVIGISLVFTKY